MNLKILTFCVSICFIVGVKCGGPQQQIVQWQKTLSLPEHKSCDKRSKFNFKESNLLIDNVPCKPERPGVTGVYHFYDFDYSKDTGMEDEYLKGKGHLFLFHGDIEDMSRMGNLKLQPLTADPDKPAKKICVKTEKFFGKFLEKASGVFMRGRLSGEATIGTSKDEQYFVNFVKGVPHGRIRVLNQQKTALLFVGTLVDGKIDGPCWKFSQKNSGRFYFGVCQDLHRFVAGSDVITGSANDEEVYSCKSSSDQVLTECRDTKISRIETNNDCIQTIQTSTTKDDQPVKPFSFNVLNEQRSDAGDSNKFLCGGDHATTSWREDPKRDLSSYFSTISNKHFDIDPYWMIGPDSSDVDRKKSVKVISGLENIEGNVYEAVLNLNGQKEAIEFEYAGSVDDDGQFDGPAVLTVSTSKQMCIRGSCKFASVQQISGTFIHGLLDGAVKIVGRENYFVTHAKVKQGSFHGIFLTFGWKPVFDKNQDVKDHLLFPGRLNYISFIGRYLNGKPVGQGWLGLYGNGFLFGKVDAKNPGRISSEKAGYIYPGFEVAIVGNFQQNFLQSGKSANVFRSRCDNGIKVVEFSDPKPEDPTFKFDPPTDTSFGDSPLIRDPFEAIFVRSGQSKTHESEVGVFAEKDIREPGSLLCLHGGLMYASESARSSRESSCDRNTTLPEETRDRCTNYRKGMFNNVDYVDVPHEVEGEEFYRATIGHKVKHSVKANALYSAIDHPRFGVIPTIISLRPIKKGEEILTDYNYKGELVNTKVGLGWDSVSDSDVKEEKTKDEL